MSSNVHNQGFEITIDNRRSLNKHNSFLLFFTGLSGSGKSTIANDLERKLHSKGIRTFSLDGDNVRKGINSDLEFNEKDREENIRRIAYISSLFVDAGVVVLASFIAPYKKGREFVKKTLKPENYVEVFVNTPLKECQKRDVKGLYKKAKEGMINNFTGISSIYEPPENSDIEIDTSHKSIEESVDLVYEKIKNKLELNINE